jgi:hypothetical protein
VQDSGVRSKLRFVQERGVIGSSPSQQFLFPFFFSRVRTTALFLPPADAEMIQARVLLLVVVVALGALCGMATATDVFPMFETGECSGTTNTGSFWSYVSGIVAQSNVLLRCCKCPPGTWMPTKAHTYRSYNGPSDTFSGVVSYQVAGGLDLFNDNLYPPGNNPTTGNLETEHQLIPCLRCPPGTASSTRGATSDQTCQPCPSGFFAANSGSDTCAPCPPGSWSTTNSSSCFKVSTLPAVDVPSSCSLRDFPSSEVVGDVLDSIDATSESACRASCCARAPCQGYTFFKPLLSIPRCTLLGTNITYVVPSNQFVSAVRSGVLGY